MNIRTSVIKSHPYKLNKLVKMNDEKLDKKINCHDKYDGIIVTVSLIFAILCSIILDFFIYDNLSQNLVLRFWSYILSGFFFIGTVFYVSSGYTYMINQLIKIPNEEKYQYKVRYLIQSSKEVEIYVQEAKEINRTLRFFDLDIMQSIADTEHWINHRRNQKILLESNDIKKIKTLSLKR